jgi:hypothetical protein
MGNRGKMKEQEEKEERMCSDGGREGERVDE